MNKINGMAPKEREVLAEDFEKGNGGCISHFSAVKLFVSDTTWAIPTADLSAKRCLMRGVSNLLAAAPKK